MIIRQNDAFTGVRAVDIANAVDLSGFEAADCAKHLISPAGYIKMPPYRITNRSPSDYRVSQYNVVSPNAGFPAFVEFPDMVLTQLRDACCSPFGAPVQPYNRQLIIDYLNPWEAGDAIWFSRADDGTWNSNADFDTDRIADTIDTAFYLDCAVSKHFGHFIVECLSRLYAWRSCHGVFKDLKFLVAAEQATGFQISLLHGAGVAAEDIVRFSRPVRCRRLLLATPSVRLAQYTSPTATRLWASIRDRLAVRNLTTPDKIYLSRSRVNDRKLTNEAEVERLFDRHGFAIIYPETHSVQTQITLLANARLVAGPSGSGLFNLAFEGRLRSAFVLVWEEFIQLSEMLISAGHNFDIWYHLGLRMPRGPEDPWGSWSVDLKQLEDDVAAWLTHSAG